MNCMNMTKVSRVLFRPYPFLISVHGNGVPFNTEAVHTPTNLSQIRQELLHYNFKKIKLSKCIYVMATSNFIPQTSWDVWTLTEKNYLESRVTKRKFPVSV